MKYIISRSPDSRSALPSKSTKKLLKKIRPILQANIPVESIQGGVTNPDDAGIFKNA